MPIYEYVCNDCNNPLEVRQKFFDDPLTDCPECGASSLERLVSNSSFALKGSGWYADGYSEKKGADKPAEAKDGTKKDEGKKDEGKKKDSTESKPKEKANEKAKPDLKKAS